MAGTKKQRHLPIGYRIQNGRAEIIPEEAELIQRIFQDYQEGATIYGIAKWMTELGVLNANGHPSWNLGSIGNLFDQDIVGMNIIRQLFQRNCFNRYRRDGQIRPVSWDAGTIQTAMQTRHFEWEDLCGECGLEYRKYAKKRQKSEEDKWCWKCSNIRMEGRCPHETEFCQKSRFKSAASETINMAAEHPELAQMVQKKE